MIEIIGITLYQWHTKRKIQSVGGFIGVPTLQKDKLTENQIATITGKNWILA